MGVIMQWSSFQENIFNFVENNTQSAVINAVAGSGKGGWVESIIPTPLGNRRFGDLKVGDYVFGRNGKPTKVLGVYPRGYMDAYKVTLADGRSAICSLDHLWGVYYEKHGCKSYGVKTLEEILGIGYIKNDKGENGNGKCKFYVPTSGVHEYFSEKKLTIDPYVLGAFISSGCLREKYLTISSNDEECVTKIGNILGYSIKKEYRSNYNWKFLEKESGKWVRTYDVFGKMLTDKCSFEKYIPKEYMTAPSNSRFKLISGLFDTNGCVTINHGRLNVTYCSVSKKLIDQLYELLLSVGIVSSVRRNKKTDEYTGKECYSLQVLCEEYKKRCLFSLARKIKVCESIDREPKRNFNMIGISKIEKLKDQLEIQCIYVDNSEHLYLCENSIVTHNTSTIVECAKRASSSGKSILFLAFNKTIIGELEKEMTDYENVECKTLHSHGFGAIISSKKLRLRLDKRKWFTYLSENFPVLSNAVFEERNEISRYINKCLKLFDLCRINLVKVDNMKAINDVALHHGIIEEYDEEKVVSSLLEIAYELNDDVIDFVDMITLPCMNNTIKRCVKKYDLVFVDECQDLSQAQRQLLLNSVKKGGRFIAVGDPKQSINGFAGADCDSFYKLKELANGNELPLSVCYRCGKNIVSLAKDIVPEIEAFENSCSGIVKTIKSLDGLRAGDFILSRKLAPAVSLCFCLIANGKTAKVRGKDILEGLKELIEKSKAKSFAHLFIFLEKEYEKTLKKVGNRGSKNPENSIQAITFRDRIECIKSVAEQCSKFEDMDSKLSDLFTDYEDGRYITLSTIHRAKGLEADRVFIILPNTLPLKWKGQKEWEKVQEMNLKYVAITRAKKELYFVDLDENVLYNSMQ